LNSSVTAGENGMLPQLSPRGAASNQGEGNMEDEEKPRPAPLLERKSTRRMSALPSLLGMGGAVGQSVHPEPDAPKERMSAPDPGMGSSRRLSVGAPPVRRGSVGSIPKNLVPSKPSKDRRNSYNTATNEWNTSPRTSAWLATIAPVGNAALGGPPSSEDLEAREEWLRKSLDWLMAGQAFGGDGQPIGGEAELNRELEKNQEGDSSSPLSQRARNELVRGSPATHARQSATMAAIRMADEAKKNPPQRKRDSSA